MNSEPTTFADQSQASLNHFVVIPESAESGDSSVTEQVQKVFVHHPHLHRRKLNCRPVENRIVIEGEVHSFFEKQLAQEALRGIDGVAVDNRIKVVQQ